MSKAGQRKEKQHRAIEKPKLDNARVSRDICFFDLDEKPYEKRGKVGTPNGSSHARYRETCGESDNRNSMYACFVEAHETMRQRLERTLPKDESVRWFFAFLSQNVVTSVGRVRQMTKHACGILRALRRKAV